MKSTVAGTQTSGDLESVLMTIQRKTRAEKKSKSKQAFGKAAKGKSSISNERIRHAPKKGRKSAKGGGTTVVVVRGEKYKVYGGKGGRIPAIGSKSTASGIATRIGAKSNVFREVDKLIDDLRSRKKIG